MKDDVAEQFCISPIELRAGPSDDFPTFEHQDSFEETTLLGRASRQDTPTKRPSSSAVEEHEDGRRSSPERRKPAVSFLPPKHLSCSAHVFAAKVLWILPVFLLYCLAVGAIAVPKLNIILNLICYQRDLSPDSQFHLVPSKATNEKCHNSTVQSHMARFMLFANLTSGCLCALTSPRLGALSDRYGRKKIMAFTATGMLLGDVITIIVALLPDQISVYWILLEFAFGGLAGTFVATLAVVQSYAADCTPLEGRATAFGHFHACIYAGAAAGPILGGLFIEYAAHGNLLSIFYLAAGCHAIFILFVLFVAPESVPEETQAMARVAYQKATNREGSKPGFLRSILSTTSLFFRPLSILAPEGTSQDIRSTRRNLILLAAIDTIIFGVILSITHVLVLYSTYAFSLDNLHSSGLISITNLSRVLALTALLPLLSRILPPISIVRISISSATIAALFLALSPNLTLFTISSATCAFVALASPTLQATSTTLVSKQQTGELLGAISLLHALARIVIPALLDLIYSLTINRGAGAAVFVCLSGIFGVALALSFGVRLGDQG